MERGFKAKGCGLVLWDFHHDKHTPFFFFLFFPFLSFFVVVCFVVVSLLFGACFA